MGKMQRTQLVQQMEKTVVMVERQVVGKMEVTVVTAVMYAFMSARRICIYWLLFLAVTLRHPRDLSMVVLKVSKARTVMLARVHLGAKVGRSERGAGEYRRSTVALMVRMVGMAEHIMMSSRTEVRERVGRSR